MRFSYAICSMMMAFGVGAFAQCPADPTTILAGRWTFQGGPNSMTGQLIFRPGTFGISVITTTVQAGSLITDDNATGSYFLNADCASGGIFINNIYSPAQWNFTIATSATFGRTLALTSLTINAPTPTNPGVSVPTSAGTAWPAPAGCPANLASPVNLLSGTYNTVSLSNVTVTGGAGSSLRGSIEILPPGNLFGTPMGNLIARLTPVYPATPPVPTSNPPTQLLPAVSISGDEGSYSVQSDCQRVSFAINYDWPRPVCYAGYPRIRTNGVTEFVVVGANLIGDPLVSTGSIAR